MKFLVNRKQRHKHHLEWRGKKWNVSVNPVPPATIAGQRVHIHKLDLDNLWWIRSVPTPSLQDRDLNPDRGPYRRLAEAAIALTFLMDR